MAKFRHISNKLCITQVLPKANKHLMFVLFLCFSLNFKAQKIKTDINFKFIQPFCGGQKPSPEIVAELEKEKPLSQQIFYVYLKNKCIDSIKTNDSGSVSIKYKAGRYYLIEGWKHFKKTPNGSPISYYDNACLRKEWLKPNYKLTISNKNPAKLEYLNSVNRAQCDYMYPCIIVRHLPQ